MILEWIKKSGLSCSMKSCDVHASIVHCILIVIVSVSLVQNDVLALSTNEKTRRVLYQRNHVSALYRPVCVTEDDCIFKNTFCNKSTRHCQCENDYVQVGSFVNKSYISHQPMTCARIARLNDRCISDHQCIVDYSECQLTQQKIGKTDKNLTAHYCKCQNGHTVLEHDTVDVIIESRPYRTRPICSWERPSPVSYLSVLILLILLVIFILIITFVALVRYQRWRNQPYPVTITSIANSGMHGHGLNGHHHHMGSSSPPPMGSAEAEFQNDFIQVFPMHHLEPMPDKNVHAYIIK